MCIEYKVHLTIYIYKRKLLAVRLFLMFLCPLVVRLTHLKGYLKRIKSDLFLPLERPAPPPQHHTHSLFQTMTSSHTHTWKHTLTQNHNQALYRSYQLPHRYVIRETWRWQLLLHAKRCRISQTDRLFSSTKCLSEAVITGRTRRRGLGHSVTDTLGKRACRGGVATSGLEFAVGWKTCQAQEGKLLSIRLWEPLEVTATKEKLNHFFPVTWSVLPRGSPRPRARRPVTTSAFFFYDPDCGLTPSCLRQGHDRQENALKLKSQDRFYLQTVFLSCSVINPPSPLFHVHSNVRVTLLVRTTCSLRLKTRSRRTDLSEKRECNNYLSWRWDLLYDYKKQFLSHIACCSTIKTDNADLLKKSNSRCDLFFRASPVPGLLWSYIKLLPSPALSGPPSLLWPMSSYWVMVPFGVKWAIKQGLL